MSAEVNEQMTLAEAKRLMRPLARRGVRCFCCNQLVKVYRRKLAAAGCVVLIRVYRRHGRDPVHVASFLGEEGLSTSHYGDTIRLALFGLIEEVRDAPKHEGAHKAGWYRVTSLGADFIHGHVAVPSHASLYNGELLKLADERVDIRRALGRRFSYAELMQG